MSIPGAASPLFLTSAAAGAAAYQIDRSLRFNSADSAQLGKTFSSAGSTTTWTLSFWIKRSNTSGNQSIFMSYNGSSIAEGDYANLEFNSDGELIVGYAYAAYKHTNRVFKDFSSWYHIVVRLDTGNSTASDRVQVYVNGVKETSFKNTHNPDSGQSLAWNKAHIHRLGSEYNQRWMNGYLAEVHFVDGTALNADSFGEFDSKNVWKPKDCKDDLTYGTNGFYLKFADNSSDSALGTDSSGNNFDWTVSNLKADAPGLATAGQGFKVITYTGNGSTTRAHTSVGFQPDFVWIKCRSTGYHHRLFDVVRGFTTGQVLSSNLEDVSGSELSDSNGYVSAVSSTGFTTNGSNSGGSNVNQNGQTYVAWCWKAGGTASSNTDGSITTSVSANTTYGFSVITYQGNGSTSSPSIGHGLGTAPAFVIIKNRDGSQTYPQWTVKHKDLTSNKNIRLHLTAGEELATGSGAWYQGGIGDLTSTSVISFVTGSQTSTGNVNTNGNNYVCYAWSEVSGFSKFGYWTGNGSSSGPTVTLGFKPRYVLFKRIDADGDGWTIFDTARDSGTLNIGLEANSSAADNAYGNRSIVVSDTGFQVTSTGVSSNASGGKYIYAAFADTPESEGIDSLIDTPTNYTADSGNNGGNYCTLNPLESALTGINNGNLNSGSSGSAGWKICTSTMAVSSGKYYWEGFTDTTANSSNGWQFGFCQVGPSSLTTPYGTGKWSYQDGTVYYQGSSSNVSTTAVANDLLAYALDMDAGTCKLYVNNSLVHTFTGISGTITPFVGSYNSPTVTVNFGARSFAYNAPSGFKALCTTNLPDPTIADPSTAFDTVIYTGNATTNTAITGLNHSPDLLWIKSRSSTQWHFLADTVRGNTKNLASNATDGEETRTNRLLSFDSNGFTIGNNNTVNENNSSFVAWAWDAGTSTVSNTDGSITSNVRANQSTGFSIVTYDDGATNGTVGHGLNAAPDFIICKSRDVVVVWPTYHSALTRNNYVPLNDSGPSYTVSNLWGTADPTSSVFGVGTQNSDGNNDGQLVAFCWTAVDQYSAFGSYEGNGNASGPFVFTGFKPRWVIIKNVDNYGSGYDWFIFDTKRDTFNVANNPLTANSNAAEATSDSIDILSNGFKIRTTANGLNLNAHTHIYAAFAEHPFKTARAR